MEQMTKSEVVKILLKNENRKDTAMQYADAFMEYQEATINIEENGIIVKHPRTMNPMENPYIKIRDNALKKLQGFMRVKSDGLW